MPIALAQLDDIPDPGSVAVQVTVGDGKRMALMLIRQGDTVFGYVNSCPHIGTPLDFTPGKFLTREKDFILCATHGALFRIEDGVCVSGPCAGQGLEAVHVAVQGGKIVMEK